MTRSRIKLSFAAPQTQWQVPLPSTANQELRLIRLTMPVGSRTGVAAHSGPGMVYVLEGSISIVGTGAPLPVTYAAGELFADPANRSGVIYRNLTGKETAKLLLYHVTARLRALSQRIAEGHAPEAADPHSGVLVCVVAVPSGDAPVHRDAGL